MPGEGPGYKARRGLQGTLADRRSRIRGVRLGTSALDGLSNGRFFVACGLGGVAVAVAPFVLDSYTLNILVRAIFYAMLALTVDVLWGYTGYLTFGQSAFFGAGAYAAGLVFTHLGFSPGLALLALLAALASAALIAGLVGWLSFYHGATPLYASVISLVLPIVVTQLLFSGGTFTGSSSGLTGYTAFDLSLEAWFWCAGFTLLLLTALAWRFVHSDAGRLLLAMRDNELRCAYLGIDTSSLKIGLLVATALVAAVAGFGYASFSGVVAPELAGFVFGTEVIIWVALGGRGTLVGPVFGALLIEVASAYLGGSLPYVWKLFLGAAFVGVIVLLPQGLLPSLLGRWRTRADAAPSAPPPVLVPAPAPARRLVEAAPQAAVALQGVAKQFGSLHVLENIELVAHAGELVSLIGPNGAGKTTLMRCMSDGAERSSGSVHIAGHDIRKSPPYICVRYGLGRKFQTANVFDSLTVAECLRIARARLERPSAWRCSPELALPAYALSVLQVTQLDQKLDTQARHLSHGEQQALELAMVLAMEPRVVLLDEPTAGLTLAERTQIGGIFLDLAHRFGLCLLLVEHDIDFVREISTRMVVLHQGRIAMQGTVQEVVQSELVRSIYSGAVPHAEGAA
jgi:branched-chain amino acid transport system permease protein